MFQNTGLAKYKIMDGAPIKDEVIPVRLYLGGIPDHCCRHSWGYPLRVIMKWPPTGLAVHGRTVHFYPSNCILLLSCGTRMWIRTDPRYQCVSKRAVFTNEEGMEDPKTARGLINPWRNTMLRGFLHRLFLENTMGHLTRKNLQWYSAHQFKRCHKMQKNN